MSLTLGGDLHPLLAPGGRALSFDAADGRAVLSYRGLVASDARGRKLAASLSLTGDRLLVRVLTRGARVPATN